MCSASPAPSDRGVNDDKDSLLFTASRRNPLSAWYFKHLTKHHGITIVANAAEALRSLITRAIAKNRAKPSRRTRLLDQSGEITMELTVDVAGRSFVIRNDMSRGIYMEAKSETVEWLVRMMSDYCCGRQDAFQNDGDVADSPTISADEDLIDQVNQCPLYQRAQPWIASYSLLQFTCSTQPVASICIACAALSDGNANPRCSVAPSTCPTLLFAALICIACDLSDVNANPRCSFAPSSCPTLLFARIEPSLLVYQFSSLIAQNNLKRFAADALLPHGSVSAGRSTCQCARFRSHCIIQTVSRYVGALLVQVM